MSPASPDACGTCGSCADGPSGRILEVRSKLELRPGQRVELEVQSDGELGPAAAVFLLPVGALMVGAIVGTLVVTRWTSLGISNTLGAFLGALTFLLPAVLAVRAYDRAYGRKGTPVKILRRRFATE